MNGIIPLTDACCTNNGSGVLYVWRVINSVCVIGIVELFIIWHLQNILSLLRFLCYFEKYSFEGHCISVSTVSSYS